MNLAAAVFRLLARCTLALSLTALTACGMPSGQPDYGDDYELAIGDDPYWEEQSFQRTDGTLTFIDARMQGQIGNISADDSASYFGNWNLGGQTIFSSTLVYPGQSAGAIMTYVVVSGAIDSSTLGDGAHLVFHSQDGDDQGDDLDQNDDVHIDVIGCSGEDDGEWEYDEEAEEVEVEVDEEMIEVMHSDGMYYPEVLVNLSYRASFLDHTTGATTNFLGKLQYIRPL